MHHTHATTPHATLACIAIKTYCTTVLTCCDEGTITREGSTWRGHTTQERKEGQQVHKMGQVYAPHPCRNPSCNPRMHCRQTYCATVLTACDEGTITRERNRWRGDMTQERKEGQQVHKMGQVCAPHPCHNPSCNPHMHCPQNLLHNRTHGLSRRNHNMGGMHVAGRHNPREKGRSASAQCGAGLCTTPMPQPLTQPSHALPTKPIAQTNSQPVMKETKHGRQTRGGET